MSGARSRRIDPTMTVLNYLRLVERRCGTKEGCAEGDCGACTVVLGELEGDKIAYRAVNSCIQFMPTLDGRQLLTVEDLQSPDGSLHPVQQAMVDNHGSQCGFCTPGFVMSLFALFHDGSTIDRQRIDDALAGNLCRCTGYGPIIAAAEQMRGAGSQDRFTQGCGGDSRGVARASAQDHGGSGSRRRPPLLRAARAPTSWPPCCWNIPALSCWRAAPMSAFGSPSSIAASIP